MLSALLVVVSLVAVALTLHGARRRRELVITVAELRAAARTDEATGLRNRRAFLEDLELELRRADRSGRPASLMVLRVEWGPQEASGPDPAGVASEAIRRSVRTVDVGYRIGADEFAVILPETRARGALVAGRRIEGRLLSAGAVAGGVAAGIAELGPGVDRRMLFGHAYSALLAAGQDGRSPVLAYSPELAARGAGTRLEGLDEIEAIEPT
jgi:GGDEF domain-containing protein